MQLVLILVGLALLFNPTWFTGAGVVGAVALGLGIIFLIIPLVLGVAIFTGTKSVGRRW